MLWGGAIFVLLIGCVNVANLVLVRSTSRIRELATRHAMGATFGRLARQALTESTGAVDRRRARRARRSAGGRCARRRSSVSIGCRRASASSLDAPVVGFTVLLIVVVGIGVGMIPVIAMRRANMAQVIREEGRSGTQGRGPRLMRRVLVTSQVAFALMLLIGAGVLLASFDRVLDDRSRVSAPANVLTGTISLPASRYTDDAALRATSARILERAARAARRRRRRRDDDAAVQRLVQRQRDPRRGLPDAAGRVADLARAGRRQRRATSRRWARRCVAGRFFTADDAETRPRVLIIDNRLARRFWPNGDALGKRMYFPAGHQQPAWPSRTRSR